ncbi:MAG: 16S rRNA (adenine(1518)-N(6)/adenine(1519)-N(6))-dimethyltransferase [Deltaproteobacteria bacterium CG_4_8_14_3_um_filter_45_9]|nr:MAG: 16S rRNA (adenine(1518)-N(6)/adenine(1519)-N(6))-dimethyltransferase [Deltaproteobacteria bacterium CG_4_8_14_3_um_filter_45_9]
MYGCYYQNNIMTSIKRELLEYGLFPKKGLGQHFLVDRNILDKVIRTAQVEKEDVVLEVGPGLGEMTLALARLAKRVIAIEIDPKLVAILKRKVKDYPNVEVVKSDILKVDFHQFLKEEGHPIKVVANLPYQISTPLLFRFIDLKEFFSTLTLMLQKEVAERMAASPGSKSYGPLSIFVQLFSNLSICFYIKPSAFFPPPKVESAVVHIVFREKPIVKLEDEKWFRKVVKGCFSYRRKTLVNALKHSELALSKSIGLKMEEIGIDPRRRPETLSIQEFARLAQTLKP